MLCVELVLPSVLRNNCSGTSSSGSGSTYSLLFQPPTPVEAQAYGIVVILRFR